MNLYCAINDPNNSLTMTSRSFEVALTPEEMEMLGLQEVVDTPRPPDTATTTVEFSVELMSGQPTVVWVPRNWTPEELAVRNATSNEAVLRQGLPNIIARATQRQLDAQAIIDTTKAVINGDPSDAIKKLARADKRRDGDIIRLARIVGGLTDSVSTGDDA